MADFDSNSHGGLTTNRESLHASVEYKRQVAATEKMKKGEIDEDVYTNAAVASWDMPVTCAKCGDKP